MYKVPIDKKSTFPRFILKIARYGTRNTEDPTDVNTTHKMDAPQRKATPTQAGLFEKSFSTCGSIVTHTIAASGEYRIVAVGAKAADGQDKKGGRGAEIAATFELQQGDVLEILVGATSTKDHYDTGGAGVRAAAGACNGDCARPRTQR